MIDSTPRPVDPAASSLANARSLVARHASPVPPVWLTALLVASAGGGIFLASVWATEPEPLPTRTQVAFGLCLVIAFSWAAFAAHGLLRRRSLLVNQRVVAATMGMLFSTVATVLGLAVTLAQGQTQQALGVGVTGAIFVGIAGLMLLRARQARRELLAARGDLLSR